MRKVIINSPGGYDNLKVIDIKSSEPSQNEVKIRWHASSLNYHDLLVAKGLIPVQDGRVPMSDGAGEVIEVGSDVTRFQIGDKVMSLFFPNWHTSKPTRKNTRIISGESGDGFSIEESCIDENNLTRIPSNYTYAEAATLPCAALTAWRALMVEGKICAGDQVLVEGSGGMSIFALQLAKASGARVIATTSSEEKAEKLKALGADKVVNYREDSKWGRTVNKIASGGVDHVLDVGGSATMRGSIDAVKMYGNIYSIGILGGNKGEILFPKLFFKHIHLIGLAVGSREMQEDMVKAIEVNAIKPVIDKSFGLEELADAFRYQESGAHFGKIVIEY